MNREMMLGLNFLNTYTIKYGPRMATIFFLVVCFFSGCEEKTITKKSIVPVKAFKVGDMTAFFTGRSIPGHAAATEEVNLGFEVSGLMVERPVDKGDEVRKGQLLARLDPRDFQNELKAAQAERDRARVYRDRIAEALESQAVAEQDLTDAQARLEQAIANVNIKRKALNDTNIFAPFDGVVSATFVETFQRIREKEKILRLLDVSKIEFTVDIPENRISYIPYVKKSWVVYETFPNRKIPAKVKEIGNEASETTCTYQVTFIHDQPEDIRILPGMAGEATGEGQLPDDLNKKGIEVPASAIFSRGEMNKSYVWVIDEKTEVVKRQEVEIDTLASFGIIVRKGLRAGEWIVTTGVHHLSNGQKVRILGQSPKEKAQ